MMIKMFAGGRHAQAGSDSKFKSLNGSARLALPLTILTIIFVAWVFWRYALAVEAISRLPAWLIDILSLTTGAGLLTLSLLWLLVIWQWRSTAHNRRAVKSLEELIALSPREFEHYVADLFERKGYSVTVRGRSGDLGVDLEIAQPDGRRAIVQCKRYRHAIGPDIVRELFGTMIHEMVHHGFLVTTAEITTAAREWAKGKPITLIDGPTLVRLASGKTH
jgi:restriction system protein